MLHKAIFLIFTLTFQYLIPNLAHANNDESTLPDAIQHLVKAPKMDISTLRDPFSSFLTSMALRGQTLLNERRSKLATRAREPLEVFDLSTLTLVGIFSMGEKRVAMIEDSQGKGYSVSQGSYLGKNNGRIEKIDTNTLYLVEQAVNPAGDIIDQQVTLTLKEVN
ncbi:MAG: pilus assembly protein PilP [Mariprofundaceae bacterium]